MNTVGELFQFATMREKTIVFGNLSRQPRVLYDLILSHHSQLQVIVVSRYYDFPSTADDKIRTLSHIQAKNIRCDLLMYLEPFPYETIHKPPGASSMVVFSSHLTFPIDDTWAKVCFFHYGDMTDAIEKTEKLLQLQDGSVQTNNIAKVRVDSVHVKHVGAPETFRYENSERSYFVVDLTSLTSPHAMLLRFWDAFDFMTRHLEKIGRRRSNLQRSFGFLLRRQVRGSRKPDGRVQGGGHAQRRSSRRFRLHFEIKMAGNGGANLDALGPALPLTEDELAAFSEAILDPNPRAFHDVLNRIERREAASRREERDLNEEEYAALADAIQRADPSTL
ncbi:hypothetical protein AVEN_112019-1, partial [Araneus ventricosus]